VFASAAYRIIVVPLVGAVAIIVVPVVLVVLGIVVGGAVVPVVAVDIIVVPLALVALGIEVVAVSIIVVGLVRIAVGAAVVLVVLVAFGLDVVTRCPVARTTALRCRTRPGACLAVSGPVAANAELVASATPSRPAAAATPSLMDVFMSVPFL
jgi:hypothetical protein